MRFTVWHVTLKSLVVGLTLLVICSSCSHLETIFGLESESPPAPVEATPESDLFAHKVKWQGESLSIIANWYTGDSKNWKALAKANPDLNPNLIRIGDNIIIPQGLLKNSEPMPRDFLSVSAQETDAAKLSGTNETTPEKPKLEREQLELLDEVWDVSLDSESQEPSPSTKP